MSARESEGVMVPYLDMLYHEAGTAQLTLKLKDEEDIMAGCLSVVQPQTSAMSAHSGAR